MVNKSKIKGTRWESTCRGFLRHWWPNLERLAQSGSADRGDLVGIPGVTIECKDARRHELASWCDETEIERQHNDDRFGILIVKRANKPVNKAYAMTTVEQMADLLYLALSAKECDGVSTT